MSAKIALVNVRVFDGHRVCEPSTVVIEGSIIGSDATGAQMLDCEGHILIPGLIDSHVHLEAVENLSEFLTYGVTTVLDMGTFQRDVLKALRKQGSLQGSPDVRSCGLPIAGHGGRPSKMPGFPKEALVDDPQHGTELVAKRVSEGADYIKILADIAGPDQAILNALVAAAQSNGKRSIVHAPQKGSFNMAVQAEGDTITHVPLDGTIDEMTVSRMVHSGTISVPTLTMMSCFAKFTPDEALAYSHARASVAAMYDAGVPILVGTDSNCKSGVPNVPYGKSLHEELERLVDAGLSTVDALRAATVLPAEYFGLRDRGKIEPGYRANLVLIGGDPLSDIRATRLIRRVWCDGIDCVPSGKA
ncbi:hypothetical protein MMC28_011629 [Mycoblastus sanguinarius]|nr:hypothetical protein [Mycoblastus sanguinarius]